ncbi:MAG: hypothetical protein HY595_05965, partial [Candidatus Omnitrophica bacterium]|nr:hypothetical protein [Candidatus Omnitrophota bacterium]
GGAFVNPENRNRLRAVGPVVCLTANPKTILQRVGPTIARRPLLSHGSPAERVQHLLRQRSAAYAKADLLIDTSRLTIDEIVERVWRVLGPWIPRSWCYLMRHTDQLCHRYGGKYIVVMEDRVVSVGTTQLQAFQRVRGPLPPSRDVGIYYIPSSQESPVAL